MNISLSEIHKYIGGDFYGENVQLTSVGIDTRTLESGACYVAIKGENFDGNDFVDQAIKSGAKAAVVQRQITTELPSIVVDNTRLALTRLATAWRQKCGSKVIGITGSNGKTTVKEMIATILKVESQVLSTQGNLNNDIGVPLTLLKLEPKHKFAVIEMGANHPGEIADLGRCALPDIGVITNVGTAHIEGFGDIDGVAKAKGEMFAEVSKKGVSIINADDAYYDYWKTLIGAGKQISFGLTESADVYAKAVQSKITNGKFVTDFMLHYQDQKIPVQLALAGYHNVVNALAATAAGLAAGLILSQVKQGLEIVQAVPGRMEPMTGKHGGVVINDSYNANPTSLEAALKVLTSIPGERWVVLGAFGELGLDSETIHSQMGKMIKSTGVVRLAAIGPDAKSTVKAFGKGATFFASQDELISALNEQLKGDEVVLIKGSRAQRMEYVTKALTRTEVV
jgi:UDP-N-acetylmuramoyl-tripeptide--D-alanyl-D-alanine ligase